MTRLVYEAFKGSVKVRTASAIFFEAAKNLARARIFGAYGYLFAGGPCGYGLT